MTQSDRRITPLMSSLIASHHCLVDRAPSPRVSSTGTFPCTARRFTSAPAVATVGGGCHAGGRHVPCTKPRVWQLSVFALRLARPLCSFGCLNAQRVCDENDSVKLIRQLALFKRSLCTCVKTLYGLSPSCCHQIISEPCRHCCIVCD